MIKTFEELTEEERKAFFRDTVLMNRETGLIKHYLLGITVTVETFDQIVEAVCGERVEREYKALYGNTPSNVERPGFWRSPYSRP